MSDIAVKVEGLSKRYQLGTAGAADVTLRDAISGYARSLVGRGRSAGNRNAATEEFWALRDVSFEVKQGEVVGIIGRNGAGKSTLLKILSRITEPTRGRISINGRVSSLLEVGTGFHPELTGRENIFLNGAILGMGRREIRAKFDEIVEFAEVERFLDTAVKRYSSGMYVRLAFAVAAHLEPEILVVDEVLAVGDLEFQKKCLGKMSEFSKTGRTVIFVSHDLNSVLRLCPSSILFRSGQLILKGDSSRVVEEYKTQARREFIGNKFGNEEFSIEINGSRILTEENCLVLIYELTIKSNSTHKQLYYAIDIMDAFGTTIAQAFSVDLGPDTIIGQRTEKREFRVYLPRLIPGEYTTTFWTGPHNTSTTFLVNTFHRFDIVESPSKNRTIPHTRDHGSFVPKMELVHVA